MEDTRTLEASTEEENLKEEDTSTETGKSEENETDSEEDTSTNESTSDEGDDEEEYVPLTKEEHEALIEEKDNYKEGMLSAKGKNRGKKGLEKDVKKDVSEEAVVKVLSKREESKALNNTINSKHDDYIPELVDDNQYNQIIGFLPRNVDKTSYESIVRGLKQATKMWKDDRGIVDKSSKKDTGVQTTKSKSSSGSTGKVAKKGLKILKPDNGASTWFNE